jgi:hypothetical protein
VYLHTHCVKQFWVVQYLEADLKTPLGRMFHYTDLNFIRDIHTRAKAEAEAREQFESGIRWGIGCSCFTPPRPSNTRSSKPRGRHLRLTFFGFGRCTFLESDKPEAKAR